MITHGYVKNTGTGKVGFTAGQRSPQASHIRVRVEDRDETWNLNYVEPFDIPYAERDDNETPSAFALDFVGNANANVDLEAEVAGTEIDEAPEIDAPDFEAQDVEADWS